MIPGHITDTLQLSSPETGHGTAVVSFNVFSVVVYGVLVIYQKKLSRPRMTLCIDIYFKLGILDFATTALLGRIDGA